MFFPNQGMLCCSADWATMPLHAVAKLDKAKNTEQIDEKNVFYLNITDLKQERRAEIR